MFPSKLNSLFRPLFSFYGGRVSSVTTAGWNDKAYVDTKIRTGEVVVAGRSFSIQVLSFLNYARKEVPFKYERKKKPEMIYKSGDNEGPKEVDLSRPLLGYEKSEELKTADETVKKLFSLEFANHREVLKAQINEMLDKVRRHPLDVSSIETRIAHMTVRIRNLQVHMKSQSGKDKSAKVVLKELIDERKKRLKLLRKADYQRFEWLLGVINVTYHPPPRFFYSPTRKGTLRSMTREHCIQLRQKKIEAYREALKVQQAVFLKEKEETLKWIQQQEKEMNIDPKETEEPLFVPPTVKKYYDPDKTPPKDYQPVVES